MKIFNLNWPYGNNFCYDEIKVAIAVSDVAHDMKQCLDYEDICIITKAIYRCWNYSIQKVEEYRSLFIVYPWMEIIGTEEEGYSQAYAYRTASNYIRLYQLMAEN